jgi:hypothetical protein
MYIFNTYNFGDRHGFGITFELSQDRKWYEGSTLRGSVCYWIFGTMIGDLHYGVEISNEVWIEIEWILKNAGRRTVDALLFSAEGNQIFQAMHKDMANKADDIVAKNQFGFVGTYDFWKVFRVSLQLDIMDEYEILLFEHDNKARIMTATINKEAESYEFQFEYFLERGEIDAVLQEAFDWLQNRYKEEIELEKNIVSIPS